MNYRTEMPVRRHLRALALAAVALVCIGTAQVRAGAISYALTMCENLDVLKSPMNKTLAMNAAWKTQHLLMLDRTMPFFELRNTSELADLKQISISIGDVAKNFDWGKLIEASPGVKFSLASADAVAGGEKTDTLVINFENFKPGDFVRFRTGISPDSASQGLIQDYRMTLFHLDGNDASHNSLVSVGFSDADGDKTLEKQMPNFTMMGMATSTSLAFPDHYMDMVMPFTLGDQGTTGDGDHGPPQVPEPSSFVLLGLGLVGLARWRLGRPRRR